MSVTFPEDKNSIIKLNEEETAIKLSVFNSNGNELLQLK